jgi:hypothetical protein
MPLREAYAAIRKWYQSHIEAIDAKMADFRERRRSLGDDLSVFDREHARRRALIGALPPEDEASERECRAVFDEVMTGILECGSGESDGRYTMAEYVRGVLGPGPHHCLSEDERAALSESRLWPYLTFSQPWARKTGSGRSDHGGN